MHIDPHSDLLSNTSMDIDEIRRRNILAIENEMGAAELYKALGMSAAQYYNLRDGARDSRTGRPRGMRPSTARRFDVAARKPLGWLDQPHETPEAGGAVASAPVSNFASRGKNSRHPASVLRELLEMLSVLPPKKRRAAGALLDQLAETPHDTSSADQVIQLLSHAEPAQETATGTDPAPRSSI